MENWFAYQLLNKAPVVYIFPYLYAFPFIMIVQFRTWKFPINASRSSYHADKTSDKIPFRLNDFGKFLRWLSKKWSRYVTYFFVNGPP